MEVWICGRYWKAGFRGVMLDSFGAEVEIDEYEAWYLNGIDKSFRGQNQKSYVGEPVLYDDDRQ